MSSDAPEIKDHRGPWDERLAYAIVALPFVAIGLLVVGYLAGVATGTIPAPSREFWSTVYAEVGTTVVYAGAVLIGIAYLLAVMKMFGSKPVQWIAGRVRGAAAGYQPLEERDRK